MTEEQYNAIIKRMDDMNKLLLMIVQLEKYDANKVTEIIVSLDNINSNILMKD